VAALLLLAACSGGSGASGGPFVDLDTVALASGPVAIEAWVADTPETRARGLMDARPQDLAPLPDGTLRGMLFVFPAPAQVSFWMRDTEVALDLAYLDDTGRVLAVHALQPLDETQVPSPVPVRYALEVAAGTLGDHGIGVGDTIDLP
jgi:uncharacterized membrane protein (UPF0127 family)